MDENRDRPCKLHTCQFCPYCSKSALQMFKHVHVHQVRVKTDTFTCDSNTPEMFSLKCKVCEFGSNLKVDLTEHFRVFHEGKEDNEEMENILRCYCCKHCGFKTHSLLVLTKHVNECNTVLINNWVQRRLQTMFKRKKLSPPGHGEWYEYRASGGGIWRRCKNKYCGYRTKEIDMIRKHLMERHTNPKDIKWFKCLFCTYKTLLKRHLRHHMKQHSENLNWFHCAKCAFKSFLENELKTHVLRKHPTLTWFRCEQCDFKSRLKSILRRHIAKNHPNSAQHEQLEMENVAESIFENIKRYKCEQCVYKCKQMCQLKRHMIHHTDPEDRVWFACEQCAYKSLYRSALLSHVRGRHGRKYTSPKKVVLLDEQFNQDRREPIYNVEG